MEKELEILEQLKKRMGLRPSTSIPKRKNQEEYPLSFAQESMWFTSELDVNSAAYNIPLGIRIVGGIDLAKLQVAFNAVVKKHEMLRATFKNNKGEPVQHITPYKPIDIEVVPVTGATITEQESLVKELVDRVAATPISLKSEKLFNISIFQLSEAEHILLLVVHHIIFDGWSTEVLMQEISKAYRNGGALEDDFPVQYADYAEWQKGKFETGDYQNQVEYWNNKIGSSPSELKLPLDNPKKIKQNFQGDICRFKLDNGLVKRIKKFSKEKNRSSFIVLLSAYYLFLYKYTNQKEIILGVPFANRKHVEIESMIGFIANTVPLKASIEPTSSMMGFIEQISKNSLEAQDHQDLPFNKLVELLNVKRTLSSNPIFQSLFVYQNRAKSILELGGCLLIPYEVETNTSKFDLSLSFMETTESIDGFFEFSTHFEYKTIDRMMTNYIKILEEMIDEPNKLISDLNGMSETEELLVMRQSESTQYDKSESITQRFEEQAKKYPQAAALVFEGEEITYLELDQQSNQLARYLRKNGVSTETRVAIKMDRSPDFIISLLGVLKAGGTYIPLDSEQPQSRLDYIIEDSGCEVLLTQEKQINIVDDKHKYQVINYEKKQWKQEKKEHVNVLIHPDQVAYIIYTSGSTGKPKGVLNTHHNVRRLFFSSDNQFHFTNKDSWTLFHSLAFDFTVWEIWGALFYGGKLFIIPSELRRKPEEFYRFLHEKNITVLNQTPSAFRELLNVMVHKKYSLKLRYIVFGGEALHFQDLRKWFSLYGDSTKLINMYGITETTVHVTWREVTKRDTLDTARSLIGKPLNDLKIYILNEDLNLVPIGVPGEIYVSGEGIARGYNARYKLTAERFIPNPFSDKGDRLYKTGDIAEYNDDGDIEYVGRSDDQVKIKGHRIELGEIKNQIVQIPHVMDCAVLVRSNTEMENEIAAFVTFNNVDENQVKVLRKNLVDNLPMYMFPSHIIAVQSIPITSNGKIDTTSLWNLCSEQRSIRKTEPESKIEKDLTQIWKQVLNKQEIYLNDNFFSLGGDSIRILKVISEAERNGYFFTLQDFFKNQTIEELVQLLEQKDRIVKQEKTVKPFSMISDMDRQCLDEEIEDAYPLSKVQEGMFFHMEQQPNQPLYHNIDSVLFRGEFDYLKFKEAVQEVVSKNVMLRTSFDLKNFKDPLQLVHKTASLPVGYLDIKGLEHHAQEQLINEYVQQEKQNTFDLSCPSLIRFFIHQRSNDTFQFSLTECHLIFDGWSLTSTLAEIFHIYFQLLDGEYQKNDEVLSINFRDFVYLEQLSINSEEHINFWKNFLSECQSLQLPICDSKKQSKHHFKVRRKILELSKETSKQLKKVSETYKLPVKSILLASHIKALHSISGQSDIVTGMVSNGRMDKKDGENVKGLFINTLPFRQYVGKGNWLDLMSKTFEIETDILPYRRLPLPEIQRHINQSTLFETAFNYVYFHAMEPLFKANKLELLGSNKNSANDTHFKLMVTFSNHPPDYEIRLTIAYDESTFTEKQMDNILEIYHNILKSIGSNPLDYHDTIPFLPEDTFNQIVHEWNNNTEHFTDDSLLIHELIEKQARLSPKSVALIDGQQKITYERLNSESQKVANYLLQSNITNDFVGIYMDRSIEMIIGLVGILKAGCAYVPLDTSNPWQRIEYMLKDSKVKCTLTSAKRKGELDGLCERMVIVKDILKGIEVEPINSNLDTDNNLAYMIYTSGSTGQPKGVVVPHKGVVNRILWMKKHYEKINKEIVLFKTPISFDYSVFEIFGTLCIGSTLVIAKPEGHKDTRYLANLIKTHNITTLYFVPTMLQEFLNVADKSSLSSIKRVMCTGEALPNEIKEKFFNLINGDLYNQYGPTEASVEVTSYKCRENKPYVRIGRPMANTKLYILNEFLQPVGIGVTGDLYIGGLGLANAYHGKPSLTADSFIPNPFTEAEGERMYKTGDLAKFTEDGEIDYVGRKDSQIKMRGLRIELGEVEASIREQSQLSDVVVLYRKDKGTPQGVLIAYVIPNQDIDITEKEIKTYLKDRLPRFMIPEMVVLMKEFPINPNGKLDRKALPKPDIIREAVQQEYTPPTSFLEKKMVKVFQEILQLKRVGIDDDFFELGGNSLSSVHLMNQMEKIIGQKVPLDTIYEHSSIRQLLASVYERNSLVGYVNDIQRDELKGKQVNLFTEISGSGNPLFIISEIEGIFSPSLIPNVMNLVEIIGTDNRFIGIQPPPFLDCLNELDMTKPLEINEKELIDCIHLEKIDSLAELILEGIRKVQPYGPYKIGAYSTGSLLGIELARKIESLGEELELLFFITEDSKVSDEEISLSSNEDIVPTLNYTNSVTKFYSKLAGDSNCIDKLEQSAVGMTKEELWEKVHNSLLETQVIGKEVEIHVLYNLFKLYQLNIAAKNHILKIAKINKIQSDFMVFSTKDQLLNWSELTKGKIQMHALTVDDSLHTSSSQMENLKKKIMETSNRTTDEVK